jgi:hypothetical protein
MSSEVWCSEQRIQLYLPVLVPYGPLTSALVTPIRTFFPPLVLRCFPRSTQFILHNQNYALRS